MAAATYLLWSPLASVAVWFTISGYLLVTEKYRTWTERFFLGMCLAAGSYGLSDAFFFQASERLTQTLAASASLYSVTLVGLFLCLYGISLYSRFRRALLLLLAPTAFLLAAIPFEMFSGFTPIAGTGPPTAPDYNLAWFVPWIVLVGGLWLAGLYGVTRSFLEIRRLNRKLANRVGVILLGLVIAVIAGASTNALVGIGGVSDVVIPPLFSTSLALPGILVLLAVTPGSYRGLNRAFLRRKAAQYDVKGAFLTYSDGTLIGSQTAPEERMIDPDAFSAMLDVIQNFMRTSFPTLRGRWLRSIRHGDYTLLIERGRFACLTLVLAGNENDQLRRDMIEHLEEFERKNDRTLERWRGVSSDAEGVDQLLDALLSRA